MERGASSGVHPSVGSPVVSSRPLVGTSSPSLHAAQSGAMYRTNSGSGAGRPGAPHLRRRSSAANMHSTLLVAEQSPKAPSSSGMERVSSLTTFMNGGAAAGKGKALGGDEREKEKRRANGNPASGGARPALNRRMLYTSLVRLLGLVAFTLVVIYLLKFAVAPLLSLDDGDDDASSDSDSAWLPKLGGQGIFDSLETVPYPLATHPRTPRPVEQNTLSLADYLTTRLGSHFSFPASNLPGRATLGSQLWLTTATNHSVATAAQHLVAFVDRLSATGGPSAFDPTRAVPAANSSSPRAPLENRDQRGAKRAVVTLCLDLGCMEYCRRDARLYCFGGGSKSRRDVLSRTAAGATNADEVVKIKGVLETLESGRRVFWVDDGTYFKEDPVPYMGDLSSYDLQIPESWTTGHLNSGISFFNPTQHVISLFRKLLTISLLSERERYTWASTNLLLDPTGQQRDSKHVPPVYEPSLDENLFADDAGDEPDSVGAGGYGQVEFESPWGGGIDVRVLEARRFRSSEGKLGRRLFEFEKERAGEALYWHCECCGDSFTNDYIAGALGFHQPSVTYDLPSPSALPTLPLILRAPELRGAPTELHFAISLLLQIAHDSGRVLVPPLTATVHESNAGRMREMEKYAWRIFPAPLWAHAHALTDAAPKGAKRPPAGVAVREPGFVRHAIAHLRMEHGDDREARALVKELEEPLVLDMRELGTLKALIHGLTRPFWSTERVVEIEGLEKYVGQRGWELRDEFDGLAMCRLGIERAESGSCAQLCPL
ncbi:hypothetical protein JCM10449v2_005160 [Rhodotorula kratochvilovae]